MSHQYTGRLSSLNEQPHEDPLAKRAREIVDGNRGTVGHGQNPETMQAIENERRLQRMSGELPGQKGSRNLPGVSGPQREDNASEDEREDQADDAPRPNESASQREMRLMNERIRNAWRG